MPAFPAANAPERLNEPGDPLNLLPRLGQKHDDVEEKVAVEHHRALARLDKRLAKGPGTQPVLEAVQDHPALALLGAGAGGLLRVTPIGGEQRGCQGRSFAKGHSVRQLILFSTATPGIINDHHNTHFGFVKTIILILSDKVEGHTANRADSLGW
jgi:hypothetical protein